MTQLAIMFLHVADLLSVSYLSVNDGISAARTSSLLVYEFNALYLCAFDSSCFACLFQTPCVASYGHRPTQMHMGQVLHSCGEVHCSVIKLHGIRLA